MLVLLFYFLIFTFDTSNEVSNSFFEFYHTIDTFDIYHGMKVPFFRIFISYFDYLIYTGSDYQKYSKTNCYILVPEIVCITSCARCTLFFYLHYNSLCLSVCLSVPLFLGDGLSDWA